MSTLIAAIRSFITYIVIAIYVVIAGPIALFVCVPLQLTRTMYKLGHIGAALALLAAGQGFSVTALMGALMVVGIAMSNGILLVDEANKQTARRGDAFAGVIAAARVRFVPIAMTSLATIVGLAPTALGLDEATAANRPLALAVVGGLSSSTVLSLFLVPVVFTLLARSTPPVTASEA